MAHLNKLAIRGIRSFDDKQISVIEFFSPVTVIVGHNGSGKTTIIECLKYATTGDQPPNTRGGAFVHDPKMANEKEVKAQVKLRFHAANGTRMLAVRNLSVTMKKTGALTMKTLENILGLADSNSEKGGKRGVISTKCAELDAEIPHLLGVSKAVLENVIFCHQEDSYWPLAEPSILKKKFDDIFEATKYTKALDSIKSLRKDRVAELKAEKERLESLQREKHHADKLKAKISDLSATISRKEIEYDDLVSAHDEQVATNKRFYDAGHSFREAYQKLENLQNTRVRYAKDLEEAQEVLQEFQGSDEELHSRLNNFQRHKQEFERARVEEVETLQEKEQELQDIRAQQQENTTQLGTLRAQEQQQEERLSQREQLIHQVSSRQNIKGFEHSPLERERIIEFIERIGDAKQRLNREVDSIQSDIREEGEVYNRQRQKLSDALTTHKTRRDDLRKNISKLQSSVNDAEMKVDASQSLAGDLRTLAADIEEKKARIEKLKADMRDAQYEARITERQNKARALEERRDALNAEFRSLSLQADSRARLDIKRSELKTKKAEVDNTLDINAAKFLAITGTNIQVDSMERDLDRAARGKAEIVQNCEHELTEANRALHQAEATLSSHKAALSSKQRELKGFEKRLKDELGEDTQTVAQGIADAMVEINLRTETTLQYAEASKVYELFLEEGKKRKVCVGCNRHLEDSEMELFETYVRSQIQKSSPKNIAETKDELADWELELKRLQSLLPLEASINRLKDEIPGLEKTINEQAVSVPNLSQRAEETQRRLEEARKVVKDVELLKQHASVISKTNKDIERIKHDIQSLENELVATGSVKTADSVQLELDEATNDIRINDRETKMLQAEQNRQNSVHMGWKDELYKMELQESNLRNDLREREHLEEKIEFLRTEITTSNSEMKDLEAKIAEAQSPIDKLDHEHQEASSELSKKLTNAQSQATQINRDAESLDNLNKAIERYVKDQISRRLKQCQENSHTLESGIAQHEKLIEKARARIADIEKEIHTGEATQANLRENVRVRKLMSDIANIDAEIRAFNMEETAKAHQEYERKYASLTQKESELQNKYTYLGGEITTLNAQLKEQERDLKDFKDVQKKYTEQLIKVKMSDMANSDLEKYAKALDNAIMKYHSLKMEEVNDNMRHLWNKTYQGTDIDGIKIRYDAEGGTTKRSYNYRVVMTKDQVEMDMRGRCSAGQKMLASIIIRLALSDSFSQNCGILALDEPTNALDIENIDALAASLVDIINERKDHSNFQLIIITHDENFLRKLGQSEVMEYYWRVSRDARQKSVIERQRFR